MTGPVAVVGGYGDVGAAACRRLADAGVPLRIGGRDPGAAQRFAATLGADHAAVDFTDESSVDTFANGCAVLLNCAGPSRAVGDSLVRGAERAGADYVDVAGDDPLYARLGSTGIRAVLSAGLRPGLTGLLPRALASRAGAVRDLVLQVGVRDRFTRVSAAEYLDAGAARVLAGWDHGPKAGLLTRHEDTELPFFPGTVTAIPLLSGEDERVALALGLVRGEWWSVVHGEHVRAAFGRVHAVDRDEAVAALCRASELDLAGGETSVTIVARAESGTAVLTAPGNAAATGTVAAFAVQAVLRGDVPPGRHYAAEVLDPERLLASDPAIHVEYLAEAATTVEEGVL